MHVHAVSLCTRPSPPRRPGHGDEARCTQNSVVLLLTFVHYSLMINPQHMRKLYQRIDLLGNHNYDMTIIIMAVITHTGGIVHVQKDPCNPLFCLACFPSAQLASIYCII